RRARRATRAMQSAESVGAWRPSVRAAGSEIHVAPCACAIRPPPRRMGPMSGRAKTVKASSATLKSSSSLRGRLASARRAGARSLFLWRQEAELRHEGHAVLVHVPARDLSVLDPHPVHRIPDHL